MLWTKDLVIERLRTITEKGYLPIPDGKFREDDGVVGQILEKEFGINENNIHLADLGTFELKGMRYKRNKPNMLTLFHQKPAKGLTTNAIFNRFGYIKQSHRSDMMKKKLFTTIRGDKLNNLGFILKANGENEINLYWNDEYLSTWDLTEGRKKIAQVILVFADTTGVVNSHNEQFHYTKALFLKDLKNMSDAINSGAVVMDLCIDQPADGSKGMHDRGPHIRIPIRKLNHLFECIETIL